MSETTLAAGALVVLGVLGTVVPVLPGALLVGAGVLLWAVVEGSVLGWLVLAAAVVVLAAGAVAKYALAGRSLVAARVPQRSLVVAGLAGVVGFFVLPVVGLLVGFVLGLYGMEHLRLGAAGPARRTTVTALKAVGVGLLLEVGSAVLVAAGWALAAWSLAPPG